MLPLHPVTFDSTLFLASALKNASLLAVEVEEFISSGEAVEDTILVESFLKEAEETHVISGDQSFEEYLKPAVQSEEGSGEAGGSLDLHSTFSSTSSSPFTAEEDASEISTSSVSIKEEEKESDVSNYSATQSVTQFEQETAESSSSHASVTEASEEITAEYHSDTSVTESTAEVSSSLPSEVTTSEASTSVPLALSNDESESKTTEIYENHSKSEEAHLFNDHMTTKNPDSTTSDATETSELPAISSTVFDRDIETLSSEPSSTTTQAHHTHASVSDRFTSVESSEASYPTEVNEPTEPQTTELSFSSPMANQQSSEAPTSNEETPSPDHSTLSHEEISSSIPEQYLTTNEVYTDYTTIRPLQNNHGSTHGNFWWWWWAPAQSENTSN